MTVKTVNATKTSSKAFDQIIAFFARYINRTSTKTVSEDPEYFFCKEYNQQQARKMHEQEINKIKGKIFF